MKRRTFLLMTALPLGAGVGCASEHKDILRAADSQPAGYPTVEALKYLGSRLDQLSNGELNLKVYSGGQLGAEKDTLEITIFGGIDINRVNLAPLNSIVPETRVPSLPFMFRSIEHMRAAMDGSPGNQILSALEAHGLVGLCFYDSGARSFYSTRHSIHTPEDMAGMKIRVQNSDLFVSMVEALGGDATPMAFGEVYQGLLQGVVDGAENNWPSYYSTRHFEAAKFYSLTRHVMAPEVVVVSARTWNRFSPEVKALVRRCAVESVAVMRKLWDARVEDAKKQAIDSGVIVNQPDIVPFQERVQGVWRKYLDSPALWQIADSIQAIRS